jgi:FkbM family methyltransferase
VTSEKHIFQNTPVSRLRSATAPIIAKMLSVLLKTGVGTQMQRLAIWNMANKYVSFYGVTCVRSTCFGAHLEVSTRGRVENEIFYFGEWEPLFTRYLRERPRKDRIFLDIGANIGYFSCLASQLFNEVHAVEASPTIAHRLKENIVRNGLKNIHVHNVAIGEKNGSVEFYFDQGQSGGSSIYRKEQSVLEGTVPLRTFGDLFSDVNLAEVGFIKVDIEGAEPPVISSIAELADKFPDDIEIFVEFDPKAETTAEGKTLWESLVKLRSAGFFLYRLQGTYNSLDYLDTNRRASLVPVEDKPSSFCDLIAYRPK